MNGMHSLMVMCCVRALLRMYDLKCLIWFGIDLDCMTT